MSKFEALIFMDEDLEEVFYHIDCAPRFMEGQVILFTRQDVDSWAVEHDEGVICRKCGSHI